MGIRAYKAFYKKNYEISGHAVERFRERVDAEFQARPSEDLSNLLDERIHHSTDRFPIRDFTKKAKRDGRIDKMVVRVDNHDGGHCFALLEDKVVVTVLTPEMVDKNLCDGSWEHVAPKFNSPFAALSRIVLPTSDSTVQRRTSHDVIESEPAKIEREEPISHEIDQPIEPTPTAEKEPMPDLTFSSLMVAPSSIAPSPAKSVIEELARSLTAASEQVTLWSVAVQEAKRNLDQATAEFARIRGELNAAILTLSGAPAAATTQIATTIEKPKATRTQGDHLFKSPYTDEEKARFVELVRNGRTVWSVSKEFKLTYSSLAKWCKDAGVATGNK